MRNEKLDIFRGLAMMWVILIHCLYWLGFFPWQKSLLLIEMPLFFFIAGASNGMASKKKLGNFYLTRFQRILIPYWIYVLICVVLISIVTTPESIKYFVKFVCDWINPFGSHISSIPYLPSTLWFAPVYLLVISVFPLFQKIYNIPTYLRYLPLFILFLLIGILNLLGNDGMIFYYAKMLVFYGFFAYLGLFYTEITRKTRILPALAIITICLPVLFVLVRFLGQSPDMQNNKFPPNFIFLVYSILALNIIYIFSDFIVRVIKFLKKNSVFCWIYQQYIDYGLTIFLFQPFAFVLLGYLKNIYFVRINSNIAFIVNFLLAIILVAVIGKAFSWCEKIKIINVKKIY
jgi:fucose 4-O-acetylase-like acetyltransferase